MEGAANDEVELAVRIGGAGEICATILDALPQWFGVPEANADYHAVADREPTVVASIGGHAVGLLTTVQHSDSAAEIYVMAVLPARHRQGVGAAMLELAERHLARQGIRFLQVKTLAETHPDPGYATTRAFYRAYGFETLEIFPSLWDPGNPAQQMIKTIAR